ncbi:response regulator [Neobacillus niacini]|uniref:response regulator transcription factor n=1 Tax=Neobacillus niacini TaxID=86668 RepID=UPI00203EF6CE|nr:response regulator [Neobacillus niacini]MCM3693587.1 response regulator [Neobacillus niacini]
MQQFLKVLIADDEPIIREGIRYSIDWNEIGMEVAAEAEDGEEALELALKYEIDILLADLNMPIMNGLALIKNIRRSLPNCRVVVISGYDEFAYAQEALRLQVDDYILKPIKPSNLTEVLERTREKHKIQSAKKKYLEVASNQILQNTLMIQEQFCRNWIAGSFIDEKVKEQLIFWGLPEKSPNLLAVVRSQELESKQPLLQEGDKELILFGVKNIVLEILGKEPKLVFDDSSGLLFILLWGREYDEIFLTIEKCIQTHLDVTVTIYSEPVTGDFGGVPSAYKSCLKKVYEEIPISPIVKRAKNFITETYTNPELTLEMVASLLQVSPVYLSRTIKQELGTSFVGLVTQKRIEKAIKLLHTTELQMVEIAEQTGYATQHYFSTAFKKFVGVSPNQYRRGLTAQSIEK